MLPENDSDGYHLGFVHLRAVQDGPHRSTSAWSATSSAIKAVVRDWGNGHIEIDWSPGYQGPFEWFGGASGSAVADFVAALERRDGAEAGAAAHHAGPRARAHLPEPLPRRDQHRDRRAAERGGVRALAHADVPRRACREFNGRLLRMAEAGMGPASFLMPEDLIVAARNQLGLHARNAGVARC